MQMEGNDILWNGLNPNSYWHIEVLLQEFKIIQKTQRNSLACLKRREQRKDCRFHLMIILGVTAML